MFCSCFKLFPTVSQLTPGGVKNGQDFVYSTCLNLSQAQLPQLQMTRAGLDYIYIYMTTSHTCFPSQIGHLPVFISPSQAHCQSKKIKNAELNGEWSPSPKYALLPEHFLFLQRQSLGLVRLLTLALLPQCASSSGGKSGGGGGDILFMEIIHVWCGKTTYHIKQPYILY